MLHISPGVYVNTIDMNDDIPEYPLPIDIMARNKRPFTISNQIETIRNIIMCELCESLQDHGIPHDHIHADEAYLGHDVLRGPVFTDDIPPVWKIETADTYTGDPPAFLCRMDITLPYPQYFSIDNPMEFKYNVRRMHYDRLASIAAHSDRCLKK